MFELRDPNLPGDVEAANWFSGHSWYYILMIYDSSMRVYGQFLALDTDHNGMLSRKELGNYNKGVLSNFFLDRLFQGNFIIIMSRMSNLWWRNGT